MKTVNCLFIMLVSIFLTFTLAVAQENQDDLQSPRNVDVQQAKSKIVGTWRLEKQFGSLIPNTKFKFTEDGRVYVNWVKNKLDYKAEGTYSIDMDKLTMMLESPNQQTPTPETDTIQTLTSDSLILISPNGQVGQFSKHVGDQK